MRTEFRLLRFEKWHGLYRILWRGSDSQQFDMGTIELCPETQRWSFIPLKTGRLRYQAIWLRDIADFLDEVNNEGKARGKR